MSIGGEMAYVRRHQRNGVMKAIMAKKISERAMNIISGGIEKRSRKAAYGVSWRMAWRHHAASWAHCALSFQRTRCCCQRLFVLLRALARTARRHLPPYNAALP
jgi:hypothetical protein